LQLLVLDTGVDRIFNIVMAPTAKQTSKPVFKTSSPFTETKW
jgi:hypothetical protein